MPSDPKKLLKKEKRYFYVRITKSKTGQYVFRDPHGHFIKSPKLKPESVKITVWKKYQEYKVGKILKVKGTRINKRQPAIELSVDESKTISQFKKQGEIRTNFRFWLFVRTLGFPYKVFRDGKPLAEPGYIPVNNMFKASGIIQGLKEMKQFIKDYINNIDDSSIIAEATYTVYRKGFFKSWKIKRKHYNRDDLLR